MKILDKFLKWLKTDRNTFFTYILSYAEQTSIPVTIKIIITAIDNVITVIPLFFFII